MIDEHELARGHPGDLPAQLGADRAAGTGDQDHLAGQIRPDALELHPHGLTPEDVLDADLAQLPGDPQLARAVLEQLEHGRGRAHGDAALASGGHYASTNRAGGRGDGDDHLIGLDLVEDAGELLGARAAQDLEAVLVLDPALAGIVVDEADRAQAQLRVARQLPRNQPPALAAADDQHAASALGGAKAAHPALDDEMHEKASAKQQREREQEIERDDAGREVHRAGRAGELLVAVAKRSRVPEDRVQQGDGADLEQGGHDHGLDHRLVVALADERPQPLVLAEGGDHDHGHRDDPQDRRVEQLGEAVRGRRLEPQPEGEEVRERDQAAVHQQLGQRVAMDGKGRGSDPPAHSRPQFSGADG